MARTTLDSSRANGWPMQLRAPTANGVQAKGCLPLEFSGVKRSGSKRWGSGQELGFMWQPWEANTMGTPAGKRYSWASNSTVGWRTKAMVGVASRRGSLTTLVSVLSLEELS